MPRETRWAVFGWLEQEPLFHYGLYQTASGARRAAEEAGGRSWGRLVEIARYTVRPVEISWPDGEGDDADNG